MINYFTPVQRRLAIECAVSHIEIFISRRHISSGAHQEHQQLLRARFRAYWKSALAAMRRDAKQRRWAA